MAERGFPLPGSSYKELIKIIQGYRQAGQDAVPSDVARVIGIHETVVSRNNRFLVAVGIVQGGKKKTITPTGNDLALALEHGIEEKAKSKWREIVEKSEFLQKVVAAVRIRKGMDESSLATHVAYSAGQPKTSAILTGAGTIVEILKVAGVLQEEAGNLVAVGTEIVGPEETEREVSPATQPSQDFPALPPRAANPEKEWVRLSIEVRIQCTPGDLDGLGAKLRKVMEDLNLQQDEKDNQPGPAESEGQTD